MAPLRIRRIHCGSDEAAAQFAGLRNQLSAQGNVVSARGRELTAVVRAEIGRVSENRRARSR